jgi:hypothetical protein
LRAKHRRSLFVAAALVVAVAEHVRATFIYTSDVGDLEALLVEAENWHCNVVAC